MQYQRRKAGDVYKRQEPAMACIGKGYHILLEKPMAETAEKTREIVDAAKEKGILLMVCHVLRHTPFFKAMKDVIDKGTIEMCIRDRY